MTTAELNQILMQGEDYKIEFKHNLNTQFSFDTFFRVSFIRRHEAVREVVPVTGKKFGVKFGEKFGVSARRSQRLVELIFRIYHKDPFTVSDFAREQAISERQIEKDIQFLTEKGLITFQGSTKTGKYHCTPVGDELITALMNNAELK